MSAPPLEESGYAVAAARPALGEGARVEARWLPWLLGGFALLWLAAAAALPPIQDETYYWTWSRAPAWSYVDHPPGVALVLAASTALFGDGWLGLRLPTLLATALSLWAGGAAALRLAGPGGARWALVALCAAPMLVVGYLPATPDPFQGGCVALAAYALVRSFEPLASPRWSFLASLSLVGSVIFKHSSAVLALGVLLGALCTRPGRGQLARWAPWLGALCGLLLLLPWLASDLGPNGSIAFQAERVVSRGEGRGLLALPVLLGGTLAALGPAGVALFASATRWRRWTPLQASLLVPALLLLLSCLPAVWRGGGEVNWSMPALLIAVPALVQLYQGPGMGRWLERAGWVLAALLAVVLLHVAHPFLPIPARKDTTQRGAGFAELARTADRLATEHGARLIITRRYQLASQLRYHLRDARPVLELGTPRRSQYDAWERPALCAGELAVLVLPGGDLPAGLDAEPVAGVAPVRVERTSPGGVVERHVVQLVRARSDRGRCGGAR